MEYCSHYQLKFEKMPKIVKKTSRENESVGNRTKPMARQCRRKTSSELETVAEKDKSDADPLASVITISSSQQIIEHRNDVSMQRYDMPKTLSEFLCHHPDHRELAEMLHRYKLSVALNYVEWYVT